ncbi:cholinesterase [Hyaloscypha variabilis F]|uniref:Carboxylic ester hydrolase n=1 Tax=Hyaloscypha variabilis (strain UAMH 11265 / GT02V1 / F) TaxID=1149755 RepID=A0A2J6S247_HYAVF|nr:cholinesterase [Hyaloscypha variabilis F]
MFSLLALFFLPLVFASPTVQKRALAPTVNLQYATVVGSSLGGIDSFKGIPYAQPPVGSLRLKPPQPITSSLGTVVATGIPRACPQFLTSTNSSELPVDVVTELTDTGVFQALSDAGEDCLTVNVQRPSSATANSSLPVVYWMFGGAFEFGSTQTYDASELISTSVAQGKDIIYVAVNYRVGGFGFLAGKEILEDGSANIGNLDQRLGLQWVADNIAKFGGDPSKVTIWGESAGSISVFNQMALYNGDNTYKGKPLFRAALMDSGSVVPADPVDCPRAQDIYNTVVDKAGCSGSSDTLGCLRSIDYETFLKATTSVPGVFDYQSVALSYLPRPDGAVITQSPDILAQNGQFAKVPFIIGDQEDEGTLFSLIQSNISTTDELVDYLSTVFFHDATVEQIQDLGATYPDDPSAGSPYRTGALNEIYPQYKRLASILGDLAFTLTRRIFLNISFSVHPSVPSWSCLASYDYGTPVLGTFHASDILTTYGITPGFATTSIQSYYISFFNTMDPNNGTTGLLSWPQWSEGNELMNFLAASNVLLADDFRSESYNYVVASKSSLHI